MACISYGIVGNLWPLIGYPAPQPTGPQLSAFWISWPLFLCLFISSVCFNDSRILNLLLEKWRVLASKIHYTKAFQYIYSRTWKLNLLILLNFFILGKTQLCMIKTSASNKLQHIYKYLQQMISGKYSKSTEKFCDSRLLLEFFQF